MPSLNDVVRAHTDLGDDDLEWLHLLTADWQIIADLSFADLVLWLPDREGHGYWAGAQMRPTTGPTAFIDDLVGGFVPRGRRSLIDAAMDQGRVAREGDPEWRDEVPVRVEAIPVRRGDRVLGVIARSTNLMGIRTPSRLELAYLDAAADLTRMIAQGHFPYPGQRSDHADSPRVGDGLIRIDAEGRVVYVSPNGLTVFRRLGLSADLTGLDLAEKVRELVPANRRADEESISAVLRGRVAREIELDNGEAVVVMRCLPLRPAGTPEGALVLVRDLSDIRRRDRELLTKDATIREIHHRVKNNLQTVAALLRLQSRRITSEEAKAALEEAVRRVGSIAVVHDTLSQGFSDEVAFDDVADQLRAMVGDLSAAGGEVDSSREGSFGTLPAEVATALAMILVEVMQNAIEHGLAGEPGHLTLRVTRAPGRLLVDVDDDGKGLPEGFVVEDSPSLGLSIVRTLVDADLGGTFTLGPGPGGGTRASLDVPLP